MNHVTRIHEIRALVHEAKLAGRRVGLVPTMGALHAGHELLIRECAARCDVTIVSLFVNPLQFAPGEDYQRYPRDPEADARKAQGAGAATIFAPTVDDMYSPARDITVVSGRIASRLEGEHRPGHFEGVLTVVCKLLNIVAPHLTVFGQKDYQQATLVRAMLRDLSIPVELLLLPTVRDADGLALSSRNRYLDEASRAAALGLPAALATIAASWKNGETASASLCDAGRSVLAEHGVSSIDYVAMAQPETLEPAVKASVGDVALIAARVGSTRLIDNLVLGDGLPPELERFGGKRAG